MQHFYIPPHRVCPDLLCLLKKNGAVFFNILQSVCSLLRIILVDEKRAGRGAVRPADQLLAEIRIGAGKQMLAGIVLMVRAGLGQGVVRSYAVGVGYGMPPKS